MWEANLLQISLLLYCRLYVAFLLQYLCGDLSCYFAFFLLLQNLQQQPEHNMKENKRKSSWMNGSMSDVGLNIFMYKNHELAI